MTFCGPARDTVLTNRQTEKLNFDTNYITMITYVMGFFRVIVFLQNSSQNTRNSVLETLEIPNFSMEKCPSFPPYTIPRVFLCFEFMSLPPTKVRTQPAALLKLSEIVLYLSKWSWIPELDQLLNHAWFTEISLLYLAIKCSVLSHPTNGRIIAYSTFCGRKQTEFICYSGYQLRGSRRIACQSNGRWSAASPTCIGKF